MLRRAQQGKPEAEEAEMLRSEGLKGSKRAEKAPERRRAEERSRRAGRADWLKYCHAACSLASLLCLSMRRSSQAARGSPSVVRPAFTYQLRASRWLPRRRFSSPTRYVVTESSRPMRSSSCRECIKWRRALSWKVLSKGRSFSLRQTQEARRHRSPSSRDLRLLSLPQTSAAWKPSHGGWPLRKTFSRPSSFRRCSISHRSSKVRSRSSKASPAANEHTGHMVTALRIKRAPSEGRPGILGQRSASLPTVMKVLA